MDTPYLLYGGEDARDQERLNGDAPLLERHADCVEQLDEDEHQQEFIEDCEHSLRLVEPDGPKKFDERPGQPRESGCGQQQSDQDVDCTFGHSEELLAQSAHHSGVDRPAAPAKGGYRGTRLDAIAIWDLPHRRKQSHFKPAQRHARGGAFSRTQFAVHSIGPYCGWIPDDASSLRGILPHRAILWCQFRH